MLFIYPYSPNWNLKGLQAAPNISIAVTFHALVHKLLWEWNDTSCMHIRFGHKDLGQWQDNLGEFIESRYMYVVIYSCMYTSGYYLFCHIECKMVALTK